MASSLALAVLPLQHLASALQHEREWDLARYVIDAESSVPPCRDEAWIGTAETRDCIRNVDRLGLDQVSAWAHETCVGEKFDKRHCRCAVASIRKKSWVNIRNLAENYPSLHMNGTLSMPREPRTKVFKAGGGYGTWVNCRSDGLHSKVFYRHIWKAAGAAIIRNMNTAHQAPQKSKGMLPSGNDWEVNDRCWGLNRWRDERRLQATGSPRPILFTFVRNPIDKFIAGYKEMQQRGLIGDLRGHPAGQSDHFAAFLDMVLHGGCDNGHVLLQASSFMGDDCESRFDYIGRLEHFADDWKNLSRVSGCETEIPWDDDLYHHESETDAFSAYLTQKTWEDLRSHNAILLRMLCWWLLPDYAIFKYDMPPECSSVSTLAKLPSAETTQPEAPAPADEPWSAWLPINQAA